MPGTASLPVFEASATPATDPANGQFYDNAGVPYFVNASGVATALTGGGGSITRAYFGDGSDGAAAFNGSTVTGASGTGPYTLTRDVYYTSCTLNASTVVNTAGFRIFCTGTLTFNVSFIQNNGAAGSGATGGAGGTEAFLGGTVPNTGATAPGSASTNGNAGPNMATSGYGGAGGAGGNSAATQTGGAGGTVTPITGVVPRDVPEAALGAVWAYASQVFTSVQGGGGGGSGATGTTGIAGGGGGGGGVVVVCAETITGLGTITANGGAGGAGTLNSGSGGGGGGGVVIVVSEVSSGWTGGTSVVGGALGSGGAHNGVAGSSGLAITIAG